jgi:hypothetical protein
MLTLDDLTDDQINLLAKIGSAINISPSAMVWHINQLLLAQGYAYPSAKIVHRCQIDQKWLQSVISNYYKIKE